MESEIIPPKVHISMKIVREDGNYRDPHLIVRFPVIAPSVNMSIPTIIDPMALFITAVMGFSLRYRPVIKVKSDNCCSLEGKGRKNN